MCFSLAVYNSLQQFNVYNIKTIYCNLWVNFKIFLSQELNFLSLNRNLVLLALNHFFLTWGF